MQKKSSLIFCASKEPPLGTLFLYNEPVCLVEAVCVRRSTVSMSWCQGDTSGHCLWSQFSWLLMQQWFTASSSQARTAQGASRERLRVTAGGSGDPRYRPGQLSQQRHFHVDIAIFMWLSVFSLSVLAQHSGRAFPDLQEVVCRHLLRWRE